MENTVEYHARKSAEIIKNVSYCKQIERVVIEHASIIDTVLSWDIDIEIAKQFEKKFQTSHGASWGLDRWGVYLYAVVENTKLIPDLLKWINAQGYRCRKNITMSEAAGRLEYEFKGGNEELELKVTLTSSNCRYEQRGVIEQPNMVLICD